MSEKLNQEQKDKVRDFIEDKKKNTTPKTVKGKNLKNGEQFEYKLGGNKPN